jgi:hypothetical protein
LSTMREHASATGAARTPVAGSRLCTKA